VATIIIRPFKLERRLALGVSVLALMAAAGAVRAAPDAAPVAQPDPGSQASSFQVDEVIVTANKREEKQKDIAGSVAVVGSNLLNDTASDQLADYSTFVPGLSLYANGAPGRTMLAIRGITTGPNQVASSVGTYIDDVPFGSSTSFANGGTLTPDLDPSEIQQVEVLRGPQGTLYGASSLGGLIKYDTVAPSLAGASGGMSEELNSVDGGGTGYSFRVHGNTPIVEDVAGLRLSAFYRDDPGFTNTTDLEGDNRRNVNANHAYGVNSAFLYQPNERLKIRLNALYNATRADGYNDVTLDSTTMKPAYGDRTAYKQVPETNYIQYDLLSSNIAYDAGPIIVTSSTSYSNIRDYQSLDYADYVPFLSVPSIGKALGATGDYTQKVSEEIRLSSREGSAIEWVLGGFYTHERSTNYQAIIGLAPNQQLAPTPDNAVFDQSIGVTYQEFAAFGDLTYHFTPTLDATFGIRYSTNSQGADRERNGLLVLPATPLAALVYPHSHSSDDDVTYLITGRWRFAPDNMVYVRAASGYRPGGPITLPPTAVVPAGYPTMFQPDTVWNYEIGYKAELLQKRLSFDGDVFYVDWSDIQALINFPPFHIFGNAGDASSKGVELQSDFQPIDRLSFHGVLGYTDATLTRVAAGFPEAVKGETLPYAPKWTASLLSRYAFPLRNAWTGEVGADVRYVSNQVTDFSLSGDDLHFSSYVLGDLQATAWTDKVSVQVFIKNVTDRRAYTGVVNYITGNPGQPDVSIVQPRTFGVRVTQSF
jgi:iron complex outermembrane recepter protein